MVATPVHQVMEAAVRAARPVTVAATEVIATVLPTAPRLPVVGIPALHLPVEAIPREEAVMPVAAVADIREEATTRSKICVG
jgi:hypothetical protein